MLLHFASLLLPILLSSSPASAASLSSALCTPPAPDQDDTFIECLIEITPPATPLPEPALPPLNLTVVEYNIDRNGRGGDGSKESGLSPIISLLQSTVLPDFDVLLLSEVARGCDNWAPTAGDMRSGAAAIAETFPGFYSAYSVEYVNVDSASSIGECTIGNAIVSRYPLEDVSTFTFPDQCCRYGGRWGGRSAVCATLASTLLAEPQPLICSTHLESGQSDFKSVMEGVSTRAKQASVLSSKLSSLAFSHDQLLLLGGDMNAPLRKVDPTRLAFEWGGFHDTLDGLDWEYRATAPEEAGGKVAISLDMIYANRKIKDFVLDAGVCEDQDACFGISDHVPIYTTVLL